MLPNSWSAPKIDVKTAILYDYNSDKILFELEPDMEGCMVFFPAKLHHQVFPFYDCDDYRVSVSGNISIDINRIKFERVDRSR